MEATAKAARREWHSKNRDKVQVYEARYCMKEDIKIIPGVQELPLEQCVNYFFEL